MEHHIAIIDPDPVFAQNMSNRLLHMLPESHISRYSPLEIVSDASIMLTEDVILYDEIRMDLMTLHKHISTTKLPLMIPLTTHGTNNRRHLTATELSDKVSGISIQQVMGVKDNKIPVSPPFLFASNSDAHDNHRSRGHVRMMVSFADRVEREQYVARNMQTTASAGQRVVRLDLMPGMGITNPFPDSKIKHKTGRDVHSYGISDLLLQLETTTMAPSALLSYVQIGTDGYFHFGFPQRADDIICCQPKTLLVLLYLLRQLAENPDENTVVLVVIESFPFRVLRQLCTLAHELHIILPPLEATDAAMCDCEIHDLFSCLSPNMLTFVSSQNKVLV